MTHLRNQDARTVLVEASSIMRNARVRSRNSAIPGHRYRHIVVVEMEASGEDADNVFLSHARIGFADAKKELKASLAAGWILYGS